MSLNLPKVQHRRDLIVVGAVAVGVVVAAAAAACGRGGACPRQRRRRSRGPCRRTRSAASFDSGPGSPFCAAGREW